MSSRKLRVGMIGGGIGAFIGGVHRIAFGIDGMVELVAGAFSSRPETALASGEKLMLDSNRVYTDYKTMLETEAAMPADKRLDFICVVTPNHLHFDPVMMALGKGFHVAVDKPVAFSLEQAKAIRDKVKETGLLFLLTHTYTGYPMIKQAKQLLRSGVLGPIRKVYAEYPQGWLSTLLEATGQTQASWRTDPNRSGAAGSMGDIGTHAFNMAEYVTGLEVTALCAALNIIVPGRLLDDDGAVLLKFNNGATGVLMATQVAAGEENNVKIRVYGEKGGIEWKQEDANTLLVKWTDQPTQVYRAGTGYLDPVAAHNCRTPSGHPEGYLEAFANLYRNFALTIQATLEGTTPEAAWLDYPGADEGVRGMAFIENVIKSSASAEKWTRFDV